jgi:hypothetical protein
MSEDAIAEVHEDNEAQFRALVAQAQAKGYQLISGLFDSRTESVYHIAALCRNPDAWKPYKAPRCFDESDSVALWYAFDSELTADNTAGRMIYVEPDPDDDYEEGEEMPEVNQATYESLDLDEAADDFVDNLDEDEQRQVLERLRQVVDGKIEERWGDPPRTDQ